MRATRVVCSSGIWRLDRVFPAPKLLLPHASGWESAFSALQGIWSHVVDQESRDAYEEAVRKGIIIDTVLGKATYGSILTYRLFHNLQNPLFAKHKFNAKEFVNTVGPALENFHDTLGCLMNELPDDVDREKRELDEKLPKEESADNTHRSQIIEGMLMDVNRWRERADKDTDSLSARLSRMCTKECFDAFYFLSKFDAAFRAADRSERLKYVQGSCKVPEAMILNARAMVMDQNNESIVKHYEGVDVNELDPPVAAQIDVLYAMTEVDVPKTSTDDDKDAATSDDVVPVSKLAVAVLEGWLHGPEKDKDLRWKVAMIRKPFEFTGLG